MWRLNCAIVPETQHWSWNNWTSLPFLVSLTCGLIEFVSFRRNISSTRTSAPTSRHSTPLATWATSVPTPSPTATRSLSPPTTGITGTPERASESASLRLGDGTWWKPRLIENAMSLFSGMGWSSFLVLYSCNTYRRKHLMAQKSIFEKIIYPGSPVSKLICSCPLRPLIRSISDVHNMYFLATIPVTRCLCLFVRNESDWLIDCALEGSWEAIFAA